MKKQSPLQKESIQKDENEKLKQLLTMEHGKDIEISRDGYGTITLTKKLVEEKDATYKIGIDEAGRGPLAGPMVYGLVYWKENPKTKVYNDSKQVPKYTRGLQYCNLINDKDVGFIITLISPLFIGINMLCNKKDLIEKAQLKNKVKDCFASRKKKKIFTISASPENSLCSKLISNFAVNSASAAALPLDEPAINTKSYTSCYISHNRLNLNEISIGCIIKTLKACIKLNIVIEEIYVDTVGPMCTLHEQIKENIINCSELKKIVVEEKADSSYQIVGAASILAKVARDIFMETPQIWNILYGNMEYPNKFGSGYPSDPITRKYLNKLFIPCFGFIPIVRISWKPIKEIINKVLQNFPAKSLDDGQLLCHLPRDCRVR